MNIVSGLGSSQPPVHRILQKLDRASSGRVAIVEVEESTKPFASPNAALTSSRIRCTRFDQPIAESLVIPFHVVMINVRSDRPPKMLFTEQDDSRQTFGASRVYPALRVRIQIWAARRQAHDLDTRAFEHRSERFRVERIAVKDQVPRLFQKAVHTIG